jgi:alkylation response protein AidB-like acyl-CoA dehydrogenase
MEMLATLSIDNPEDAARACGIALATGGVAQAGRFVSQNAVQLHGGIGMAENTPSDLLPRQTRRRSGVVVRSAQSKGHGHRPALGKATPARHKARSFMARGLDQPERSTPSPRC